VGDRMLDPRYFEARRVRAGCDQYLLGRESKASGIHCVCVEQRRRAGEKGHPGAVQSLGRAAVFAFLNGIMRSLQRTGPIYSRLTAARTEFDTEFGMTLYQI